MPMVYDNWEKLVAATDLDREKLRQLALADSRESSFSSSISAANSGPRFSFKFISPLYVKPGGNDDARLILVPTYLTDQVIKAANAAFMYKQECLELKRKTQQLELLLKQAARASGTLYARPMLRIMDNISKLLQQALVLVISCRSGLTRIFSNISTATFRTVSSQINHSICNVSWLLRDDEYLGIPPISVDEPILYQIWELIAILYTGSSDDQCNAVASLVSLASDDELSRKMIIEEGGVRLLTRVLEEGENIEGRENAAKAIGLLAKDIEGVEQMIEVGIRDLFPAILREGPIEVKTAVVWCISEIAENGCYFEYLFPDDKVFRLLISHLAFNSSGEENKNHGATEKDETNTKAYMKAVIARALRHLARLEDYCYIILNSSTLLFHLAVLLEQGSEEAQYDSAMALMEISATAQRKALLGNSGFRSNSHVHKVIVDQLFRVIGMVDSELIIPCIKTIGNLARILRATEIRMISPLVKLLDESKGEISQEACITLIEFASSGNILCVEFSQAIISAKGANYLVKLVQFGKGNVIRIHALILLCYVALHVPQSKELAKKEVLTMLEWASKQDPLMQNKDVKRLLPFAVSILELYHDS